MKSKGLLIILALATLSAGARAQQFEAKQMIVSLPEGGFVSFKNETAWTDITRALNLQKLPVAVGSQALVDQKQTIHRVLRNSEGKLVFGYDLWVAADRAAKNFKIAIKPIDPEFERTLAKSETLSTFPKPTEPQTLSDGAEFSVDLLINQAAGVKIVDVVKVTFDRSRLWEAEPVVRPRDFTLDAVELEMKDYSLLVNDTLVAVGKSQTGFAGALLWIYIPDRGRFIFSLIPREGYSFQKAGFVERNKIEFTLNGDRFQWLSSSPILRGEGAWNLWVLHDAKYSPLFGSGPAPPPREKTVLERLDDSTRNMQRKLPRVGPIPQRTLTNDPNRRETEPKDGRRVTAGGADSIENLWPKNP
jgi:hypothetical protein